MRRNTTALLDIDLHLFDGAAGAAGGATTGGAAEGTQGNESALPKAETTRGRGSSRRARTGENNVLYGIQGDGSGANAGNTPAAEGTGEGSTNGVTTTSDTIEAKRKAFKDLIEGEYKDQYTEMFQSAFNRRFKETKGMEQTIESQKPIMDMLLQRYKIEDGDVSKLQAALEQDNRYWEEAADEAGLTVEQFKAMQKLERENAELKAMRQRQAGQEAVQQRMNEWYAQADKVKEMYPGFNLNAEAQNKQFTDLLKAGIPVQQAYELVHMDEIKQAAARTAAQAAGNQMVAKLSARASRPLENGTSTNSSAIVKSDVHSLSRADRAEIARRAQRGEKIRF